MDTKTDVDDSQVMEDSIDRSISESHVSILICPPLDHQPWRGIIASGESGERSSQGPQQDSHIEIKLPQQSLFLEVTCDRQYVFVREGKNIYLQMLDRDLDKAFRQHARENGYHLDDKFAIPLATAKLVFDTGEVLQFSEAKKHLEQLCSQISQQHLVQSHCEMRGTTETRSTIFHSWPILSRKGR